MALASTKTDTYLSSSSGPSGPRTRMFRPLSGPLGPRVTVLFFFFFFFFWATTLPRALASALMALASTKTDTYLSSSSGPSGPRTRMFRPLSGPLGPRVTVLFFFFFFFFFWATTLPRALASALICPSVLLVIHDIFRSVPVWQKSNMSLTPVSRVNYRNFCPKQFNIPLPVD